MVAIALRAKPQDVCIVPERREELTTEGGLDAAGQLETLRRIVEPLTSAGIVVSLFIDADLRQVDAAVEIGASAIELHTGKYAECPNGPEREAERARIRRACDIARDAGLIVNAGHGLTLDNVMPIAAMRGMNELNIGHSIVADAIFVGLEHAVRKMKALIQP
jgi:pyridoxine 5-phosphate synthase